MSCAKEEREDISVTVKTKDEEMEEGQYSGIFSGIYTGSHLHSSSISSSPLTVQDTL